MKINSLEWSKDFKLTVAIAFAIFLLVIIATAMWFEPYYDEALMWQNVK